MAERFSLTPQQARTLAFIGQYQLDHGGRSPTYLEIAQGLGLRSKSGVARLVAGLAERGALRRLKGRNRCLKVTGGADADVLAYLHRRLTNARTVAARVPENDELHGLARDRARQLEVIIDELSHGLHRGVEFADAYLNGGAPRAYRGPFPAPHPTLAETGFLREVKGAPA